MKALKLTILGCGSSGGVPRIGNDWGVCDPENPKNRRSRCGVHVEMSFEGDAEPLSLLIDTPPELREQLIRNEIGRVDGVLFTHDHADQTHGLDDIRVLAYNMRSQMPVYGNEETMRELAHRFRYCFTQLPGSPYPPIIKVDKIVEAYQPFSVGVGERAVEVLPVEQDHGSMRSFGFRIGDFAYCNDVVDLPEKSLKLLEGVKLFVVDALRYKPHPTHAHLEKSLKWIERIQPEQAILTNLHIDMDYETVSNETPDHVHVAYDGMVAYI